MHMYLLVHVFVRVGWRVVLGVTPRKAVPPPTLGDRLSLWLPSESPHLPMLGLHHSWHFYVGSGDQIPAFKHSKQLLSQ